MFKSITKIALLSSVAIVGTSYFMDTASAEPKFFFRYTSGAINVANSTDPGEQTPEPVEPEIPEEPKLTRLEIGHGSMGHFDSNNDGAINAGDLISVSFPITNIGEYTASNITAREVLFYIDSEIYGFHNAFPANAQCTPTLNSHTTGECIASLLIEEWMIPDNRSAYEFKSFLDGFNFSNNGGYVGPSGSDFLPLGTEMKIRFDGLQNWSFEPLPPTGNGYIEYFVYTNSGNGDPYSDYEIEVTIPELNAKGSCGESGIRHADARCVARIELTSEMQDKIYEGTPDTVTFKPYATLTKLGGRTTNQRLVDPDEEYRLNEFPLEYDVITYLNASNVTISNTGTNISDQRITVNGLSITNMSYNYVRNVEIGVYLGDGYDVLIKNVCPNTKTMKPRQTVHCEPFSYTLTPAQQKVLRDGFGSGKTVNANNQIYISDIGSADTDRHTFPMPRYDLVIN